MQVKQFTKVIFQTRLIEYLPTKTSLGIQNSDFDRISAIIVFIRCNINFRYLPKII